MAKLRAALEAGADDFNRVDDTYEIICPVDAFEEVKKALAEKEIPTQVAEISRVPSNTITLDESGARKILNLMEALEDHDDVQNVYANFDISDEILEKLQQDGI